MWLKLLLAVLTFLPLLLGCSKPTEETVLPRVTLAQSVINEAVTECQGNPKWGINLAVVKVRYKTGVDLEAAIVLHNGSDFERLVTLSYAPISSPILEEESGTYFDPPPSIAKLWVTIDPPLVFRMTKEETKVVTVHLGVPGEVKLPKNWAFDINASGESIHSYEEEVTVTASGDLFVSYTQRSIVETISNDTIWELKLNKPLAEGLVSVKSISSEIDEQLILTNYDPQDQVLTVTGLKENQKREIDVTYDYKVNAVKATYSKGKLSINLDKLLLEGLTSVKGVTSSIGSTLTVSDYNTSKGILTISGLEDGKKQTINLKYEYPSMAVLGYNQKWLITTLG